MAGKTGKLNFMNIKHLSNWLLKSSQGKLILRTILPISGVKQSLIAVEHCDRVELFGPKNFTVHTYTQIHGETPDIQIKAEELVELQMPKYLRQWHCPKNRIAMLIPRKYTYKEAVYDASIYDCLEILTEGKISDSN